ncbi:hypothetical protein PybrP1_004594 [[Pythium] brassicae (nom. inval.)]|nr:hypothetical protein PybrP1_004594 [[Pythium] brassicae (nom. inval.)]
MATGGDMRRLLLDDGDASVPPLYARAAAPPQPTAFASAVAAARPRGGGSRRPKERANAAIGDSSSSSADGATPSAIASTSAIAAALGNATVADDTPSADVETADNSRNTATMLSDSQTEREIAEFGRVLDDMLARVTCRELVRKTAEFMKAHPQHAMRFQFKIKQRAQCESARQFQAKLMLFYVLHEFLKSFQGDELRAIQRQWFQTVDEILHACVRDMRNIDDGRKRIFKTLARWEELKLYPHKIKGWKSLVLGEAKPRRGPMRLPRSEAERLAEAPDQLQQFPPPPTAAQLQIDRSTYPYLFERADFVTKLELKQHWRCTAVAFIDVLSQCLMLSRDVSFTASIFFHRVFDRGIYAQERFKVAAACLFLAAKASSKRMKLLRMVRTMHEILEAPLMAGDEEILELERMQLLYYEIEVLQGINFDLTTEMPFFFLRRTLDQMPDKFWLPVCLTVSPQFLAEAAAYIACRNNDRIFSFKWCLEDAKGAVLTERLAKEVLKEYRTLMEWKKGQRINFERLQSTAGASGGAGAWSVKDVFKAQQGGLRIDATRIQVEVEYTKRGVNESKEIIVSNVGGGRPSAAARGRDDPRAAPPRGSGQRGSWRDSDARGDVKDEPRSSAKYDDDRSRDRTWSRNGRSPSSRDARSTSSRYDSGSQKSRDRGDTNDRNRRRERSPRRGGGGSSSSSSYQRGDSQSRSREQERPRERERDRDREREWERERSRRSHSLSPRASGSSSSKKRKRSAASSARSESRSPSRSRSHSHSRGRSSSYYARSEQHGSSSGSYSRDRSNAKADWRSGGDQYSAKSKAKTKYEGHDK